MKQYEKDGGFEQALSDFDKLSPTKIIKNEENIKIGVLEDGRTIIVRKFSKEGRITLEIQKPISKKGEIKIRYNNLPAGFSNQGAIEPLFGLFF